MDPSKQICPILTEPLIVPGMGVDAFGTPVCTHRAEFEALKKWTNKTCCECRTPFVEVKVDKAAQEVFRAHYGEEYNALVEERKKMVAETFPSLPSVRPRNARQAPALTYGPLSLDWVDDYWCSP